MIRIPKAAAYPIIAAALALSLAISHTSPAHVQAQATNPSYVSIHTSQASVPEGGLAAFVLLRSGGALDSSLTVQVRSWEPNHADSFGVNDTEQFHDVTFALGDNVATLNVVAVQDQRYDPPSVPPLILNAHTLNAEVVESDDDSYHLGNPGAASLDIVDVNAPPFPQSQIYIQSSDTPLAVTEGNDAVLSLNRTGDTTQPLAVDILVDDPDGHLRGNHWEPPPQHPARIEFPANVSVRRLTLPVPDDQRDRPDGSFKVFVLPSFDYLISFTLQGQGATLSRTVEVADNDTPQELELHFGKDGVNEADVREGETLGFLVKRRQQDADNGTTATFTVRLETDRGGDDYLLSDWTEDTATGRVYKDYLLQLSGADLEVEEEFTVPENGEAEGRWTYWASIRTLEDHEGDALTTTGEAEYWTVKTGFRETVIRGNDSGASDGKVFLGTGTATAVEGGEVVFTLTREDGPVSQDLTVRVETWEPNRIVGFGNNPSSQNHWLTFEPWEDSISFSVYPYVDRVAEAGADQLKAEIKNVGGARYTVGNPYTATVNIDDPPTDAVPVTLSASTNSINEGGSATFTLTRTGTTTADLVVDVRVDDPSDFLRGNHWDPAPAIPSEVVIPAGSSAAAFTLTAPDDQRDITDDSLTVTVVPGTGYYPGQIGLSTSASVSVTDNDEAQELTFRWGHVKALDDWGAGNSWFTRDGPGPAEGLFYYDDDRPFLFDTTKVDEWFPIHFEVKRRDTDVGKTATFVVRVEHDRRWNSPRHTDWSTDPETGNRYKDYFLTLEGNQRKVLGRIEILDNGLPDPPGWSYRASIRQIEDANGVPVTAAQEARYWTVNGLRSGDEGPIDHGFPKVTVSTVPPDSVAEGQEVEFTVTRLLGNALAPLHVRVRTLEPNHRADDGTNPTEQIHSVTVPGIPMTSDWTDNFEPQSVTFPVTVANDSRYEPTDYLTAEILPSATNEHDSRSRAKFRILDDDRSTIALSANSTAVTEGDPLVFTLTRGNNTAVDLIVGVSVLDPGGFLAGNLPSQAVEAPSSVVFAPGDVTASVNLTPPDDWRDIPDSALTFTVMAEPEYEITGSASLTVPVADNDLAPQVQISFNAAEVDEGQDLILSITRTGEDKNPLEIELTAGPKDDQQYTVAVMDAGESLLTLTYTLPDDDYKSLDTEYEATLHPGPPAFWTPATPTTVTARILDNDLYTVGIEAITHAVDEGQNLQYRVYHDGHTGDWVNVKVLRSEIGSAVRDSLLGERTHAMVPGESEADPLLFTEARDGNDGDATVIIEILPGDDYEIDPDHATATMVVRDKDPLPVLGFRDPSTRVSEGVGTVDLWVDIVSPLPSLRTVTVDYSVHDTYAGNGLSVTESAGTLTFAPGETSAAITVEVLQNSIAENNEIFAVVLTNPVYTTLQDLQTSLTMLGVIEDDEPTVTVEARHPAVEEGDDVVLDLTRSGDTAGELTVWLWVSQTAPQALTRQDAVVFAAGNATAEHVIPTQDDSVRLGSYTVNASLLNPATVGKPRTYRLGSPSAAAATVRDNELSPVSLNTTNLRVIEGETITLELSRRWGTGTALTVNLSITETGQFTTGALPTSVTFGQLVDTRTIRIQTEDDRTAEDIGKLTVTLNDGTGYRAAWPNTHTFTVYDNDGAKPFVSVSADHNWVNEGEPVSFTVTRSGPTGNIMEARVRLTRVRYRVTAEDLSDPSRGITSPPSHVHFGKEELTLEFPAGTRTLTITRPTTDDNLNYGNSTYHALILNDPSDEYVAPYSQSAKVWVQDDDIPTVTGTSTLSEHNEGYNRVVIPFSRTGDVSGALELKSRITFTEFIPEPGQDITVTEPHTLVYSIQPGDASGLPVLTYGGVYFMGDGGHVQLLSHYCPGRPNACGYFPQYVVGNPSDITYRVYSDIMGVRIEADQVSVDEGEPATFTFHRLGGKPDSLTRSLQVNVLVSQEGGYISGGAPQTVTFAANEATTTLSIPTAEDMVDEADGSITVEILRSYERGDGDDRYGDDRYHYESNEYPGTPWEIYAATTVVTDDDYVPPTISISDASALETDRTISFTVSLDSANTEQAATVDWATAEDGSTTAATSDVDYTAASGALDFAIGETEKTITVALLDDELDEDNETFSVILSNPSEVILGDGTGSGAINDNELAFAVVWHSSTWHTEEGDDIVITFRRLVPLDPDGVVTTEDDCYKGRAASCFNSDLNADPGNLPLTINLAVTLEGDYFSGTAPASVTFPPGESLVNLLIPTVDDSNVEAKGTAIVQILQGSGYSPLLTGDFPGIVVPTRPHHVYDNDLTIAIDDAQADESSGQLDFTVRLNEAAPEQVTVDVATIDGEATSHANVTATSLGRDFHAKTETITFEAGEQQKTFSVALVDDKIHERDETLSAQLSIPPQSRNRYRINFSIYHGTLEQWPPITSLADGTGEGTIVDDEQPMAASVSRSYDVVNENQAGPVRFMVELSHADTTANERNVAVGWQVVAGTATEGEDYLAADGMLNFPVGSNTGALEVDLVDDHLFEKELETFTVELIDQGTRLATISPTGNSFVTSIRDNETLTASIMADALSVVEGGTAGFTVRLTGGVTQEDVQITFETGGDATGGSDYDAPLGNLTLPPGDNTGSAGTLTIPAGQKSGTITYPIKTDNIAEEDGETLEVQLFTVNDGLRSSGVSGSENIASTTILDGDSLIVSIQGNPTVAEGGTATFSVRLSETEAEDVSVEWATTQPGNPLGAGETAEPDLDYTADSGTVAIPAGSTSATFTIATNQDTLVEGDETFVVTLEQATKGTAQLPELLTLGVTMATGTITDDDTAPTGVTLSAVPDSVTEDAGATDISATVSLDGTAQFTHDTPVTIEFADRPGNPRNAIPGVDYTAAPVNTVIPAGESGVTAIITITPVDDNMEENDEIARLEAGSPDLSGTDALGVNITDNDTAVVEVELTATPGAVDETVSSTILTVTAALVGSSSRAIDTVINLSATDGTAESAEDYEFTDTTVTIPAGAMSATVSVSLTVLDDTLAEGDETFEIGGSITAASITVLPAEITIRDDDTEPTGIALSYSAAPLSEGGSPASIDLEASLLGGGTRTADTQVSLTVVDLTTTTNDDYTASWYTLTLTIPAGEYSATAVLTITPVDDNLHEGTEQLAVRAANSDPGLAVNGVRIPILDDDPQPTTITLSLSHATLSEQVKTWWVNVTATLEGASTLATDTVITTQLDPQGIARNTYGGILKSELRIEAGQSTSTAEMLLTNIDDQVDDADETLVIGGTVSDPSLTVTPASLVITDDDTYGVTIWPTTLSVREGRRNNYNVKLDTEPTATVTVTIDLPADAGFTVNPGTLTFTPQSWGTKYVIVSGTQDEDAADEAAATITHSIITTDELYRNAATSDVSITVRDDETAGVTFSTTTLEVAEGQDATYTVVLDTVPVGDVTVTIGGVTGTDLSLDKTTLTFTTTDWDAAQTVTVTAGRDGDTADDTATLTHTVASTADSAYDGAPADSIAVTVTDDVSAGVTISESSLDIEEGDSDTYTVALDTRPTGDVTVSISGHTGTDVSLDKATLTFTAQDWNVEQEVTVTAEQDGDSQDEAAVTLSHTVSSAVDTDYDGISTGSVEVSISDEDEDGVTIYPTEVTVTEGQTATYTVVLDSQPTGDVTVTVKDPTDNTAVTADPASLTFTTADWDDAQEVTVSAAQDDDDQDGSATVTHEVASTGDASYDGITAPDVGVTLEDDAPETVTVNFKESSYDTDEGSAVAVALTLDLDPERTITVLLTHAGQNGAGADDYSGVPATVVFNSGETEKSFTFSATDDTVDDDDESVLIGFGTLPADVTAGTTDETTVSITDDDLPSVEVSFEQASYTVAEGSAVNVKVKLDADPERTVTIPLNHAGQGGADNSDYSGVPANVEFNFGETEKTFSFSATADDVDDDDESVKLGFGNVLPTGVSAGTTNESIVSITDDDVPAVTVSFEQGSYTVAEGSSVSIKVKLDADPERSVTIPIANTNQSGASSADYSGVPGDVTIAPGDTEVMLTFAATQDTDNDDGESVKLGFGTLPTGVSAGTTDETTVSITDDDVPAVSVSFEQSTYTVAEGSSVSIKVKLDADPERTVTIPLTATGQDGADADDYTVPANVTFNSGETEKTISFSAASDSDNDDGESVKLGFGSTLPAGVSAGSTNETVVSITDDDVHVFDADATYRVLTFYGSDTQIALSDYLADGVTGITFTLESCDSARIDYYDSAAVAGGNLTLTSNTLGHIHGTATQTETTCTVTGTGSVGSQEQEFELYTVSARTPQPLLPGDLRLLEARTTELDVQVSVSEDSTQYVRLGWRKVGGDAPTFGVVSGVTKDTVLTIPGLDKGAEYEIRAYLMTYQGFDLYRVGNTGPDEALIADNGPAAKWKNNLASQGLGKNTTLTARTSYGTSLSIADVTAPEGAGDMTFTVTLSESSDEIVTVDWATSDGTATAPDDYAAATGTLTFGPSETTRPITITVLDDDDDDAVEQKTFTVTLSNAVNADLGDATATGVIEDDDVPSVTVSFEQGSYTVAEGSSVTVKVKLNADPERMVTVPLTKANQGGASNSDYSVPANVTFNSGETEKTISFSAASDSDNDDGESVKLGFGNLPVGVSAGPTAETVVSITDDDLPSVEVSFEQGSYTVAEGNSVTVKVKLDAEPERTVTIPITTTDQGGASSSDYSGVPASVTFNSGDTEKSISFSAVSDSDNDDGESVKLGFGNLPAGVSAGSTNETVVSITDDDLPSVEVSFEQGSYTVTEGSSVGIKVKLDAEPERTVTVPLTKANQGGASSSDYSGVPASVTFNSGDTEKSITFSAVSDSDNDDGESVTLGFGNLPAGVSAGSTNETVVSITDDDLPSVEVSFEQGSYTVTEGSSVGIKVKLDAEPERTVTVPLTKANQGGASSSDYSGVPASVTFNSGDTEKSITFSAVSDSDNDEGESVKLGFGSTLPAGVSAGSTNETVVSITDDDLPSSVTVEFGASSYSVTEGGDVEVTVTLNVDPERSVTVPLSRANQGGASDSDYSGVPLSVTFPSGETEKSFTLEAAQDNLEDSGESVKLGFGALPTGVSAGTTVEATVSIINVSAQNSLTVNFGASGYGLTEGDTTMIAVTLSTAPGSEVTIPLTKTEQGGATSADYSGIPASLTFGSSDTSKTFTFTATEDTIDDDGESVKLGFGNLPGGVTEGSTNETVVSITDDDVPSVNVSFEQGSYTVTEGSSVTVKVKLDAEPERTVTIPIIKTDQDGASSSDYSGVPASVTFNSGDTEKSITFSAASDSDNDDGESVKLGFGNLPAGVSAGSTNETVVSITDDDVPPVTVSFEQGSYTVAEGSSVTVTVTLNADPERTVTVPLTKANQGGASSSDYSGVPANVTFNGGEIEKTISFSAASDSDNDDGESVKLGFGSTLPAGVSAGSTNETVVSITDDDLPSSVTVEFGASSYSVTEGGDVEVTVTLNVDPERSVTVPLSRANQGGASDSDYSGVPLSVTFPSGETEKSFTLEAAQDNLEDSGESVKLGFGALPTGVSAGTTVEATVSIINVSAQNSLTVNFGASGYGLTEGDTTMIAVTLSTAPGSEVTIPLTKTEQGGASSADYSGIPADLTFGSTDTSKTFTFTATEDTIDDDGESVKLGFGMLPGAITAGSTSETTVSITDDDVPSVNVSFEQATYTVAEGSSVTVKVKLSAEPERTVTVPLTKANQGGASSSDYSGVPASVTFNSGDTEKTISFSAASDSDNDDGESVKLGFGNLPAGVSAGSTNETVVSITDDDEPPVTVSFEQGSYTVAEGSNVTVTVTLSADPERTVTIPLTKAGQGGATSADYSGVPANVVFNGGDTEKSFTFTAASDSDNDDGESVKLGFGNLPVGVSAGSTNETVVSITDDDVPAVEVSFEQGSYTVPEGSSVTVKVKLSAEPERTVTVPLTKANQGGASNSDYSVPANVTFNSGDTEKSITFTAASDSDNDDGESVKLGFGSTLPAGVSAGSTNETVVSITDDDLPSVEVSFEQASYTVAEGSSVTVKVKLDAEPERTVTVPLTKANQGGASNSDYSVPANVTFNSGDTEKTISFSAASDSDNDDGESVKLGFGNLPTGVSAGSTNETVVSITDDDLPSVEVSFEQGSYTVTEGSSVTVKMKLDAEPERTVTIPIIKTEQDGASSSDYSGVPANVTFNGGETEKTITFSAASDSDNDDGESVKLGFGNLPAGVSAGSTNETVVSITDDDLPSVEVSFEQATYTVAEGSSVTVKVRLSAEPERTVTVPLTKANQGGASNPDYSGVPPHVTFNSGDTEKTITFAATADDANDDGESVKLGFGSNLPTGVSAGTPNESVVSITDDDVPGVSVKFTQATYTVAEGSSINITVTLSADPERTVTIPLSLTNQGGASGDDHSLVPNSVTFNAGQTGRTFSFQADEDTVDDDGESVKIGFGNLPTGVTAGTPSETTVSITDDDVPSITASYEHATYTVAEGNSVTVKVTLSADPERNLQIPISAANQGGASSADYTLGGTSVNINSGSTTGTVTFTATQDTVDDDGESVKLTLGTLPGGVNRGTTDETTVSITDDDLPSVEVSFEQGSYTVAEGNSVTVKVKLDAEPERTVTVPLTKANQGGASSSDYSGVPANVTFNGGETEKTISFSAVSDSDNDDGESVKLGFGNLPAGVSAGSTNETVVSITDDDLPPVEVSFEQGSYTVTEGSSVTVKVKLDAEPERTVTVPLTKANQGGASSSDYSGVPASVTFNSGDTEKSITFSAVSDSDNDDGESVKLGFGNLPAGVTEGSTNETVVSITDDDLPSVEVSFEQGSYTVTEGSSVTVKVKLDAEPERTVTVPLTKANQGGAASADYSVPANVVFNGGDTEKTISFSAASDSDNDAGESVKLGFGNLPTGVSAGSTNETVVSITDDDLPSVEVSFEQASYTVAEGSSINITVTLDQDPERTVTIPLTVTNQGGATSADHSLVPENITFNAGQTSRTFSFQADQDSDNDDGESVKLGFGSTLPAGVSAGSTNETVVSITDDDLPSVEVSFEQASYTVAEGSSINITVTLDQDPERTVTIPLTVTNQGGATSADHSLVPENITFNAGQTSRTFSFQADQDSDNDDGESVKLGFGSTLPAGVSAGSTNETVVSITDDDLPSVEVSFEQASYTVAEGSSINITVTLDQDPERTVTIPLTVTNQGGVTSADHSLVPENITFNAGQTSRTFSFQADQDSDNDDGESVKLGFGSTLPAGVSAGSTNETVVSITDDDAAPTEQSNSFLVSFGASEYSAFEGGPNAAVTVQLNRAAEGEITVPITVAAMNGATQDDWTGVPPMLSFSIGQRSKTFTVMAYDDDIEDDGEAVELGFGSLPDGVTSTSPSTATVHLMNTETPGTETSEPAQCGDNQANKIILLDAIGEIITPGQSAFWEVELDPFKSYLFEAIGADDGRDLAKEDTYDGDLTLEDPDIIATWKWHEGRMEWMQVEVASWHVHDMGYGRNSISGTTANSPGLYRIEVAAGGDGTGTGTYQVKVRLNNFCIMVYGEPLYQYFGGPEGYSPNDIPADTSTRLRINPGNPASSAGNFLGDNWESEPDEDWFGAELTLGYEYTVELWSRPDYPEEHRAKKLKILGIYDSDGTEIADTASSNSGKRVSVVFRPESTGLYYIAAGSNGIQTTGLYRISATEKETPGRARRGEPVPQDQQGEAGGNNAGENNPGADDESEKRDQEADEPNSPASGQPVITGTAQAGLPLTADTSAISDDDGLSDVEFNYQWVAGDMEIQGATGSTYELSDADVGKTIKVGVSFTDDADNEETLTSSATVAVAARPNSPATGLPTISGAAQVGQTLTASTSGIGDADGLDNATFSYQWIADNSDIDGATDSTYPLVSGDEGKSVKVRVSFTDDRGNEETLTSGATAAVAGQPSEPLTVGLENTPTGHNGSDAFTFELRFSEEVKLSYKTLRDHSFTVTGGTVTRARRLDKPSNIRWEIHVVPDSSATVTVVLPVTTDCDDPGAICTKEDLRPLSNLLELTVSGPGG